MNLIRSGNERSPQQGAPAPVAQASRRSLRHAAEATPRARPPTASPPRTRVSAPVRARDPLGTPWEEPEAAPPATTEVVAVLPGPAVPGAGAVAVGSAVDPDWAPASEPAVGAVDGTVLAVGDGAGLAVTVTLPVA